MITRLKKRLQEEEGAVLVLVGVGLVALLGFVALTVDVGYMYLHKSRLVNAMDSAVLAGGMELPTYPDLALQAARDYAAANGVEEGEVVFTVSDDCSQITAESNRTVDLFFARVLGFDQSEIGARAVARVGNPGSIDSGCVPFGVLQDDFEFGVEYLLKEGAGGELYMESYCGWFGCLALGGNGANNYRENLKNGYDQPVSIGDVLPIETGNMSNPTRSGIQTRLNQCPHSPKCTITQYDKNCPRVLLVPVVVPTEGDEDAVQVVAFGAFLVTEVPGQGNENIVKGYFVETVTAGEIAPDADYYGTRVVMLVE
ncbi:MAG: hypothetical protein GX964_10335 [Syntrophomonadaceae bacterium]|nr:hypothetical protein [Syntrophomonadaceae bacterium]